MTPVNTVLHWTDHWKILFGFEPDQQEVDSLVSWLDMVFPPRGVDRSWTEAELIGALNEYADSIRQKREAGNSKDFSGRIRPPTGPQIKTKIIAARYVAKQRNEPSIKEQEICGLCGGSGWIDHYPYFGDDVPGNYEERQFHFVEKIQCVCPKGDYLFSIYRDHKKLTDRQCQEWDAARWTAARQVGGIKKREDAA